MRQFSARLTPMADAAGLQLLALSAPAPGDLRAGQCLLVRIAGSFDPYMRRAYAPLVRSRDVEPALLLPAADPLALRQPLSLDILGPVGNGFTLEAGTRRLLLVAHAAQLASLITLAHEATRTQIAVTLLVEHGGPPEQSAALLAFLGSLLPIDVEYQIVAHAAPLLPDLLRWCDQVCAAGDPALYAGLRAAMAASATPAGFAQVLLLPEIACGTGACLGCAVETAHGTRLACVDGPVFDLFALQGLPA